MDDLNEPLKILHSVDFKTILSSKKTKMVSNDKNSCIDNSNFIHNNINISSFKNKVPHWGGNFTDQNQIEIQLKVTDTCTIDYF